MDVLIKARISDDGRTLRVAPGVEIKVDGDMIATDLPPTPNGMPLTAVLFFESEADREEFAELFEGDDGIHFRGL